MSFWQKLLQGRYFGLPVHPIIVHFPVALFATALIFDLMSFTSVGTPFAFAAYYVIWVGLLAGLIAIFFGFVEYFYEAPPGSDVFWTATMHAVSAVITETIFIVNVSLRYNGIIAPIPIEALVLSVVGTGFVALTNILGSTMVYRHGLRVASVHDHDRQAKEWRDKDSAA